MREENHCFDVLTSTDRSKLLEKFLSKRYNLLTDSGGSSSLVSGGSLQAEHCLLELQTTRNKKVEVKDFKLGNNTKAEVENKSVQEISNAQILLSSGRAGSLELEGKSLFVECVKGASGFYQLTFSYSELYRSKVSSSVSVKQGESIQVAQITNDLASKSKTLGLPQSLYEDVQGKEDISYELKVK